MKHEIELVNPLDVISCKETGVHLNYRFRTAKFESASDYLKKMLEKGRIRDLNGAMTEKKEDKVLTPVKEIEVEPEAEDGIDLDKLSKAELLSFIEENGMTQEGLGITPKTSLAKIRDAIMNHLEQEMSVQKNA